MSAEFLFLLIQHVFIFIFDRAVGYLASRRSKRDQKKSFLWDRGQHVWRNWLSTRGHTRISFLGQWVSVLGRWSFGFSLFILPNPHKTLGKSSKLIYEACQQEGKNLLLTTWHSSEFSRLQRLADLHQIRADVSFFGELFAVCFCYYEIKFGVKYNSYVFTESANSAELTLPHSIKMRKLTKHTRGQAFCSD